MQQLGFVTGCYQQFCSYNLFLSQGRANINKMKNSLVVYLPNEVEILKKYNTI